MTGRKELLLRFIAAAVGGAVLSLAFAPVSFGPASFVGVAFIIASLWRASALSGAGIGFVGGFAFFVPLMNWLTVVGTDAWLMLGAFCASWWALQGVGIALVSRLSGAALWVPSVWVLQEALRDRIPWGGYPWGRLGFSQADIAMSNYAAWFAVPGVTFIVALVATVGVQVVIKLHERDGSWRARIVARPIALIVAVTALAFAIPTPVNGEGEQPSAVVAVIQGGTPQTGMGAMDVRRAVVDNHVRETLMLANAIRAGKEPAPNIVIWPENSTDIDPFSDPTVAADISRAARAVGAPILVGAVTDVPGDPTKVRNVGILWDPVSGPGDIYVKNQPVPFGEFIPFRDVLTRFIGRFDRIPRDFIAGDEPGVFDVNGVVFGNLICFEVAYDHVVDAVVHGGAEMLTVQTNNATFAFTSQPEQQLQIERIRSVETGRAVVIAATTGISAFISPDRTIVSMLGEQETGYLVEEVPLRNSYSLSTIVSPVIEWLMVLIALLSWGTAVIRTRRIRT